MVKKNPLEILKEANRRRRSYRIETPLDLIRVINRKRKIEESTKKLLSRLK